MSAVKRPAADRQPTLWDALPALLVLTAAVVLFFSLRPAPSNILTATIVLNSVTLAQYDLTALTDPISLPVDCRYPLTVEAEHGRIRISESACPGADCLRTGWADRPGAQIICLPNRLIISLTGGGNTQPPSIDGITG